MKYATPGTYGACGNAVEMSVAKRRVGRGGASDPRTCGVAIRRVHHLHHLIPLVVDVSDGYPISRSPQQASVSSCLDYFVNHGNYRGRKARDENDEN